MSGDLHATLVALVDRRLEHVARDVHVRLERRRTRVIPERYQASGVRRVRQLVDLREPQAWSLEIRRRRVDPRPGALAAVDRLLDVDLAIAVHVATGAHRRDATG